MKKAPITDVNSFVIQQLPESTTAKYIVIVVDRGIAGEVNHFTTFEEAKTAFEECARDHGYEPEEINGSDYYDVSIWEWTEDRYEKVYIYV